MQRLVQRYLTMNPTSLQCTALRDRASERMLLVDIQLFRERLSKKVHTTIPKGIVGGFEFTVLQKI